MYFWKVQEDWCYLNRLNSRTQQLTGTKQSRHVKTVVYNTKKPKQSEKDKKLSY